MAEIERRALSPVEEDAQLPILLAVSDNGPQMNIGDDRRVHGAVLDRAAPRSSRDADRPSAGPIVLRTPERRVAAPREIRDPVELEIELEHQRVHYNTVRLHAGIGYVTPEDEHTGRADAIRKARREAFFVLDQNASPRTGREMKGLFGWVFSNEFGSKSQKRLNSGPSVGLNRVGRRSTGAPNV